MSLFAAVGTFDTAPAVRGNVSPVTAREACNCVLRETVALRDGRTGSFFNKRVQYFQSPLTCHRIVVIALLVVLLVAGFSGRMLLATVAKEDVR